MCLQCLSTHLRINVSIEKFLHIYTCWNNSFYQFLLELSTCPVDVSSRLDLIVFWHIVISVNVYRTRMVFPRSQWLRSHCFSSIKLPCISKLYSSPLLSVRNLAFYIPLGACFLVFLSSVHEANVEIVTSASFPHLSSEPQSLQFSHFFVR